MRVVLDSSKDSARGTGIAIHLMYSLLAARPLRVAAFFTMLFLLIANGGVWVVDGLTTARNPDVALGSVCSSRLCRN
jgi:hypothetical protein